MTATATPAPQPTSRPAGKPFTYAEAAEALNVCEATVARAARANRVKSFRVGRKVLISCDEVRRLQNEGF